MRPSLRATRRHSRTIALAIAAVTAACSGGSRPAPASPPPTGSSGEAPAPLTTTPSLDAAPSDDAATAPATDAATAATATDGGAIHIAPSRLVASLAAHHVDVEHAGALHTLTGDARDLVMQSFADSLGVRCTWCHVDGDFAAPTARKADTEIMWDRFVHGLRFRDHAAGALYCDSCHQGHNTIFTRGDDDAIGEYMAENYVAPLERTDGSASRCTFCHGQPFRGEFLPRQVPSRAHARPTAR